VEGPAVTSAPGRLWRCLGPTLAVLSLGARGANGQPAFGVYIRDPRADVAHANGLLVLTLVGDRISAMTRFDNSVLLRFGFPRTLPD
jgi:hypothetical protein